MHALAFPIGYTEDVVVNEFAILTNRKRTIIALVHSIFFFALAAVMAASPRIGPLWTRIHSAPGSAIAQLLIYLIVSTILIVLTKVSICRMERLYFGCCATSASVGFFRALVGDPPLHAAHIVRVAMLAIAVVIGFMILREHAEPELAE